MKVKLKALKGAWKGGQLDKEYTVRWLNHYKDKEDTVKFKLEDDTEPEIPISECVVTDEYKPDDFSEFKEVKWLVP